MFDSIPFANTIHIIASAVIDHEPSWWNELTPNEKVMVDLRAIAWAIERYKLGFPDSRKAIYGQDIK